MRRRKNGEPMGIEPDGGWRVMHWVRGGIEDEEMRELRELLERDGERYLSWQGVIRHAVRLALEKLKG